MTIFIFTFLINLELHCFKFASRPWCHTFISFMLKLLTLIVLWLFVQTFFNLALIFVCFLWCLFKSYFCFVLLYQDMKEISQVYWINVIFFIDWERKTSISFLFFKQLLISENLTLPPMINIKMYVQSLSKLTVIIYMIGKWFASHLDLSHYNIYIIF